MTTNLTSITDAAAVTGLSRATLTQWARQGKIGRAVKVGRTWVLPSDRKRPTTKVGRPAKNTQEMMK